MNTNLKMRKHIELPSATSTTYAESLRIGGYHQRVEDAEARIRPAEEYWKKFQLQHAETRALLERQEVEIAQMKELMKHGVLK